MGGGLLKKLISQGSDFKQKVTPRIIAVMLAGLTAASMASCDELEPVEFGDLYKEASQVQVGDDGTKLEDIEDIEDAYEHYNDINKLYPYGVVPYNFLCEQGLMTKDAEGKYRLNSDSAYCESTILVDHNSSENDVYLFLNYSDKSEECDFTSTWKLK